LLGSYLPAQGNLHDTLCKEESTKKALQLRCFFQVTRIWLSSWLQNLCLLFHLSLKLVAARKWGRWLIWRTTWRPCISRGSCDCQSLLQSTLSESIHRTLSEASKLLFALSADHRLPSQSECQKYAPSTWHLTGFNWLQMSIRIRCLFHLQLSRLVGWSFRFSLRVVWLGQPWSVSLPNLHSSCLRY